MTERLSDKDLEEIVQFFDVDDAEPKTWPVKLVEESIRAVVNEALARGAELEELRKKYGGPETGWGQVATLKAERGTLLNALEAIYPFLYYERKNVQEGYALAPALPSLNYGSMAWFTVIERVEDALRKGGFDVEALQNAFARGDNATAIQLLSFSERNGDGQNR